MKYIYRIFILSILYIIFLTGCSQNIPGDNLLSNEWKYALGHQNDSIIEAGTYSYKKIDSLSSLERFFPKGQGIIWLRNDFNLNKVNLEEEISLYFGSVIPADRTYINNTFLGGYGTFPENENDFFRESIRYRQYDVSSSSLNNGENSLYVKIYVNFEGALGEELILSDRDSIKRLDQLQRFLQYDLFLIGSFLMVFTALYLAIVFIKRTSDIDNLYFALTSFFTAIFLSNFFMTRLFGNIGTYISYFLFLKIVLSSACIAMFFFLKFINSFLKREPGKIETFIISSASLVPAVFIWGILPYQCIVSYGKVLVITPVALGLLYVSFLAIIYAFKGNKYARIFSFGLIPFAFCILNDAVLIIFNITDRLYLGGLGFVGFVLSIAIIIASIFVEYHNEVEELNETLDKKVEIRTNKLLERTNELAGTKEELEAMNDSLLILNNELENTYRIMVRDMRMAANVQKKIFPQDAPENNEWEISFYHKALADISGDFYDFYVSDGKFLGTALFDVSGHGIASGLITMIARSIVYRKFNNNSEKPLNKIFELINNDLINEIGQIDNFVTGILLRMNGSIIEYVNSAHPDLLIKSGETGAVNSVKPEAGDFRGYFLGVPMFESPYAVHTFQVPKGDCLLLYSDCLIESLNENSDQYGMNRVMKLFEDMPAGDRLSSYKDAILSDLYGHIGSEILTDDLTIILMRKL